MGKVKVVNKTEDEKIDAYLGAKNLRKGPSKTLLDNMYDKERAKEKRSPTNYMCRNNSDIPVKWDQLGNNQAFEGK